MRRFQEHPLSPLLLLLTVTLTVGLLTFRSYGLSWDEPLFYDYANAIWKAYTPQTFAPGFDFDSVYGRSASDHQTRGPAYLLLARPVVQTLLSTGLDEASAWHLVNFLTFQLLGVGCFYLLMLRWVRPPAAFFASALFASQPLLWGHAFINPKDTIFTAFFVASVYAGLRMIDQLSDNAARQASAPENGKPLPARRAILLRGLRTAIWPGIIFGLTISVRILAPLAGVLILLYAILRLKKELWSPSRLLALAVFGVVALAVMFITWPYLWANPLARFGEVLALMSEHPASIQVLFSGELYRAYELPWQYLPKLLALTLTEPVWPLFALGVLIVLWKKLDWNTLALMLLWFAIPFFYVVLRWPPLSDNYRHFLFMLPPVFIFTGLAFEALADWLRRPWAALLLGVLLLAPGIWAGIRLHPYEYTYYNQLTGRLDRTYETDYWLTCYREATQWVNTNAPGATLHVQREPGLVEYYARGLTVKNLDAELETDLLPGDLLLLSTRANMDTRSVYRKLPIIFRVGRGDAEFCLVKRKE